MGCGQSAGLLSPELSPPAVSPRHHPIMFWAFAFEFVRFQQLSQGCGVLLCLVLVVSGLSGPWSVRLCKPFVII